MFLCKLKGKVTPKNVFFWSSPIKTLSSVKLLTVVSASKMYFIPRHLPPKRPKFGIDSRHFETNAQRPGQARPLSVTLCRSRDFVLASVFVLEVMVYLQLYSFVPEHVPNPEDSESENEEVNDWLKGTFGVLVSDMKSCQRKENVFVAENS